MSDQQEYQRDDAGNIVDPPTLSQHERAINDAAAAGDDAALARAQKRYDDERRDVVAELESANDDTDPGNDTDDTDPGEVTDEDVQQYADQHTADALRDQARQRGLDDTGNKPDLAARILEHDNRED